MEVMSLLVIIILIIGVVVVCKKLFGGRIGLKRWSYEYGENTIMVEYRAGGFGEKLYVNGEVQDENMTATSMAQTTLQGILDSGEKIKVVLGGVIITKCSLFIDNKLQVPINNNVRAQKSSQNTRAKFCSNCGTKTDFNSDFCGKCGSKL